jgi:hypothetical protein
MKPPPWYVVVAVIALIAFIALIGVLLSLPP